MIEAKEILEEATRYTPDNLGEIPTSSGVYLMRNKNELIIYVGKAINLRSRVRSYFRKQVQSPKNQLLISRITSIEVILVRGEVEALILENNLIKKHRPRFNINLKDDKTYPFIRLTVQDEFPRIHVTRTVKRDGSLYYGPYTSAKDARQVVMLLEEYFSIRRCRSQQFQRETKRSCLNHEMGICAGVCLGKISAEDYAENVRLARRALQGSIADLVTMAEEKMKIAAAAFQFEKAAFWRNRMQALAILRDRQKVVDQSGKSWDLIASANDQEHTAITLFQIRDGKFCGKRSYFLDSGLEREASWELFLGQYYAESQEVPPQILLHQRPDSAPVLEKYLEKIRGLPVQIRAARSGEKELLSMAFKNSRVALENHRPDRSRMEELQKILEMDHPLHRIECYDISNISGTLATGSMVVFLDGQPANREYRRFRIRHADGINDFAMMEEMLERRFARLDEGEPPDLLVIDGGVGHLSTAVAALKKAQLTIPVISLSKKEETIHQPGEEPLVLPRKNKALQMLIQLRDEAHRFAITYHRSLRSKQLTLSRLEEIPGIGPAKIKALFDYFSNIQNIKQAGADELHQVTGISEANAKAIIAFFAESEDL